jgi:hypothetical protein
VIYHINEKVGLMQVHQVKSPTHLYRKCKNLKTWNGIGCCTEGNFFRNKRPRLILYMCPNGAWWSGLHTDSGANPTIVSYNASAVKTYNATSSLLRFESRNSLFYLEKTLYSTTTPAL